MNFKQKEPPRVREQEDGMGVWDGRVRTAVFKMHIQQGPTTQRGEFCAMLRGSLDGGELGGEWIRVYVRLSPFAVLLNLSPHC